MKKTLVFSCLLLLSVTLVLSCNDAKKNNSTTKIDEDTLKKSAAEVSENKNAEVKKYSFYKLPVDIADKMKNGEITNSEELEKFKVEESALGTSSNFADCVVHDHSTIRCTCKAPDGTVTVKTGVCDVYYANEGGKWVYCYTRCESCINVCNK